MKLPKKKCATCPFNHNELLLPEEMAEIRTYLLSGTNHFCNSDRTSNTVCLGGRKFQLEAWHRMGTIAEPTND